MKSEECRIRVTFILCFKVFYNLRVEAVGDVADGSHCLEVRRALVDGGDAGVAIDTLAGIFEHEA